MAGKPGVGVWEPLRVFLGSWVGTCTGKPGDGRVERTHRLILRDKFLQMSGRSTFEPQERNPEGEVHEELGLWSFDRERGAHVYREFLVEGFVSRYVLEPPPPGSKRLVLSTEAIESLPAGWQARTTYEVLAEDHVVETFELRRGSDDWACYIRTELRRSADA